jgi:hypothetical protein
MGIDQISQINQTNEMNQIDQTDRTDNPITSFWPGDRIRMPWRLPC